MKIQLSIVIQKEKLLYSLLEANQLKCSEITEKSMTKLLKTLYFSEINHMKLITLQM